MPYRVGLVGASRGSSLVRPFGVFPETEITALCDLNQARAAEVAKSLDVADTLVFSDYERFLDSPIDIVVVGTPIQFHAGQAVAALEAGKHVLSEVTAAYTLEDCQRIVDATRRSGRTYMMAENCCYFHFIRQWKGWIDAGRLGDIFYAEAEYIHNIQHLLYNEASGESYWRIQRPPIYYCTHSLGPLLYLMDDRITRVSCLETGYGIMPDLGPGCLNMEVALMRTQKGASIKLLRSQVAFREPPMHFYSLYGTRGSLENDRTGHGGQQRGKLYVAGERARGEPYLEIACPEADPAAPPEAYSGGHGTSEYYLVRDFIDAVTQGTRPPIDAVKAAEWTAPGLCAHASALQGGAWVDVPRFG
jgi:predicted dehydrogenase